MKLNMGNRSLIDSRQSNFITGLEDQMQKQLDKKEEEIQNTVHTLLSGGYETYQVVNILSLLNNKEN